MMLKNLPNQLKILNYKGLRNIKGGASSSNDANLIVIDERVM